MNDALVEKIDALLPQTQCQKCGYKGCKPYAQAISEHKADINQCPPGGEKGIQALADLLGVPAKPLDPQFGVEKPRSVAVIIEKDCIGCTKCLPACPVDAILGASKQMHTVISAECTGCELCIAPCPVDCIVMQPVDAESAFAQWTQENAAQARKRYQHKLKRLEQDRLDKLERLKKQKQALAKLKAKK